MKRQKRRKQKARQDSLLMCGVDAFLLLLSQGKGKGKRPPALPGCPDFIWMLCKDMFLFLPFRFSSPQGKGHVPLSPCPPKCSAKMSPVMSSSSLKGFSWQGKAQEMSHAVRGFLKECGRWWQAVRQARLELQARSLPLKEAILPLLQRHRGRDRHTQPHPPTHLPTPKAGWEVAGRQGKKHKKRSQNMLHGHDFIHLFHEKVQQKAAAKTRSFT